MKFEGPTPETETRQVSVSFAAFIVVMAFVLFGIAMAMGTITSLRTPAAPQQPETTAPEEGFESQPAPLPAVTQPDPSAVTEPDPADTAESESTPPPESEQPAPPAAQPVVAAATPQAPRSPASETAAAGTPPADTHDASFPTHHASKPAAPATAPAAPSY